MRVSTMTFTTRKQGFSLIEVAIGLLIISTIVTPMMMAYNINLKHSRITTSTGNIGLDKAAMLRYAIRYGCYPLPAAPGVTSTNATFGQEAVPRTSCASLTALQLTAIPVCAGNDTLMC